MNKTLAKSAAAASEEGPRQGLRPHDQPQAVRHARSRPRQAPQPRRSAEPPSTAAAASAAAPRRTVLARQAIPAAGAGADHQPLHRPLCAPRARR